jgi:hypothetical protein
MLLELSDYETVSYAFLGVMAVGSVVLAYLSDRGN